MAGSQLGQQLACKQAVGTACTQSRHEQLQWQHLERMHWKRCMLEASWRTHLGAAQQRRLREEVVPAEGGAG